MNININEILIFIYILKNIYYKYFRLVNSPIVSAIWPLILLDDKILFFNQIKKKKGTIIIFFLKKIKILLW